MAIRDFQGKVAVVTGAASGIGAALAAGFAARGARVVMADRDSERLASAAGVIEQQGGEVTGVVADVSRAEDVEALARTALSAYGRVHIVCNNAGVVSPGGPAWEKSLDQWEWVLGANLWGVIHGVRAFIPLLLRHGEPAHIVNTASAAGLISMPWASDYFVSKHGVVALSESIYLELRKIAPQVGVSVLCPGFVRTSIMENARRRFPDAQDTGRFDEAIRAAEGPEGIAAAVFDAIERDRFYILTHPELMAAVEARFAALRESRPPENVAG